MKSVHDFLIAPAGERYNNISKTGLILNTEMQNHNYVNRSAIVLSTPVLANDTDIQVGDLVLVHHNIFRRFRDVRGIEKNSKAYFTEEKYLCPKDQIYAYKPSVQHDHEEPWQALPGFTFVQPIKETRSFQDDTEIPLWGIVSHPDKTEPEVNKGDIVGFTPSSEFEFIIDGIKVYRILSYNITVTNGRERNEIANNPSWTSSS